MFHVRQFWQQVRAVEATIEAEAPFLMSLNDPLRGLVGGRVVQVARAEAAKAIAKKTHRLATAEEVAVYLEAEQQRVQAEDAEKRRKLGLSTFVLPASKGRK
jgi:hypothetical protein